MLPRKQKPRFFLFVCAFLLAGPVCNKASAAASEDPEFWIQSGQRALKTHQDDLARGNFDQAIKLAQNDPESIVRIGLLWLKSGRLEPSLPYLLPNLSHLNEAQLERLEKILEERRHLSAAILLLQYEASQKPGFAPEAARASELAFLSGQYALCSRILIPHAGELDSAGARRLLLAHLYLGEKLESGTLRKAASRSGSAEIQALAAVLFSLQGNFRESRAFVGAGFPVPVRGFLRARELDAADKTAEAVEYFKQALDSDWPQFRIVALTEFFKHYSLTGNRYKVDQLWDEIKEKEEADTLPGQKEFLAYQLGLRGYEKQSRYLYRSLYRSNPGRAGVLKFLWDELIKDDSPGLNSQIGILLARDSLDCDANLLAMNYDKAHSNFPAMVHHGRNVALFCPDVVEPYFDLANALLAVSRPDEARIYYGKFLKRGGDRNRIPTYMR